MADDLVGGRLAEDPEVQRVAAESLAARTGMTTEQAIEALDFQDAAHQLLDDVERALGPDSGGMWFDWSDHRGRLKAAVVSGSDPPSGPNVEAAERILAEHGLVDRVDFIEVKWTLEQLQEAQERAWEILDPLARVTQIMTAAGVSENSIVIETANDLTEEQLQVVQAAVRAAGVSVRIDPSLGPSPDRSLPPVAIQWSLSTVGPDLRSLVVHFSGGVEIEEAVVSPSESEDEICLQITTPDPRSSPATARPAILVMKARRVELQSPISGRRLTVPPGSPPWRGWPHLSGIPSGRAHLVPRVLGLHPEDADRLLRDQDLQPRVSGEGRRVIAQDPDPDTPTEPGARVRLTAGPTG